MGLGRVELPTSPLSGVRSSHLSYRPGWLMIKQNVPEPKSISTFVIPSGARDLQFAEATKLQIPRSARNDKQEEKFFEEKVERATRLSPV